MVIKLSDLSFYEKGAMQVCFGLISVAAKALGCAHIVKLIMAKRYFMNSQTTPKKQNFNFQVFREMIVVADNIVMNFNGQQSERWRKMDTYSALSTWRGREGPSQTCKDS